MSGNLGRLTINIGANTSTFEAGMDKAERQARKSAAAIDRAVAGVGKSLAKIGVGATAAAVAVAKVVESTDQMAKAARAAGLTAEQFQELTFAAERSGVSSKQLEEGMRRLNRRFGEFVNSGGGPAAKAFEALGISAVDTAGKLKTSEEVFTEIVSKLEGVESQAQKAALASQLFGDDAGPKLALLLAEGADGVENLREEARKLGVVSNTQAAQAEAAADAITNLKTAATNTFQVFALRFAPALQKAAEVMVQFAPLADELAIGIGVLIGLKGIAGLVVGLGNLRKALIDARVTMIAFSGAIGVSLAPIAAVAAAVLLLTNRSNGYAEAAKKVAEAQDRVNRALAAGDIASAIREQEQEIKLLQEQLTGLSSDYEEASENAGRFGEKMAGAGITKVTRQINEKNAQLEEATKKLASLNKRLAESRTATSALAKGYTVFGKSADEAAKAQERLKTKLQSIIDRLDPLGAAVRLHDQQVKLLRDNYKLLGLTGDELEEMLRRLGLELERTKEKFAELEEESLDALESSIKATRQLGKEGEESADRFQLSWATAFDGLGALLDQFARDGQVTFDRFADFAISSFERINFERQQSILDDIDESGLNRQNGLALGGTFAASIGTLIGGGTTEAALGAQLGSAIGLALGGPIGQIIGGLGGGLLDRLFGSDDTPRFQVFSGFPGIDQIPEFRRRDARETPFGVVALEGVKNIENGAIQELLDGIVQFDQGIAGILRTLGDGAVEAAATALRSGNYRENFSGEVTIDQILTQRLGEIVGSLEPRIRNLVEPFASQGVEQGLQGLTTAIQLINAVDADPLEQYNEAIRQSNLTVTEALREQAAGVSELMANYDGSLQGLQNITAGVQSFNQAIIQTIAGLDAVAQAAQRFTENGQQSIALQVARARDQLAGTNENQFEFLRRRANQLIGGLDDLSSADAINRQLQLIDNLTQQAFSLLSPEEQIRRQAEFQSVFENAGAEAQERAAALTQEALAIEAENRQAFQDGVNTFSGAAEVIRDVFVGIDGAVGVFGGGAREIASGAREFANAVIADQFNRASNVNS